MRIGAVDSVSEKMHERGAGKGWKRGEKKKVDAKVQGVVQTKIVGGVGSLFVSVVAPFLLSNLRSSIRNKFPSVRQTKSMGQGKSLGDADAAPLGLSPCGTESWMNAVMQIMLRLPMFRAMLALWAPQSYEPFQKFVEQYDADRKAHLSVSSASSFELVRCLMKRASFELGSFPKLFEIFRSILLSFSFKESSCRQSDWMKESCCLLDWDPETLDLQSLVHQKVGSQTPRHLLIFIKEQSELNAPISKQLSEGEKGGYYDLHGFIERRFDAKLAELIAYVKVAGKNWYQCRDHRIFQLHSPDLEFPLGLSRLWHFKRCTFQRG